MQTQLIAVGNSKGIRLPKALLAQCGIEDKVDLLVTDRGLLISPVRSPRHGWEEAIAAEAARGPYTEADAESAALTAMATLPNEFDDSEWTWPQHP